MKTGTDTYIQWKQEHFGQDVIRSYSSYICHNPARKNTQTNSILPFPTESLSFQDPLSISNFSIPPFLGIFGKVNPPLKKGGGRTMFRWPSNQHKLEKNSLKIYTIDPEICSILIFQIRIWEQFLQHILCMIFQKKCSSCYILLTDQI